MNDDTPLDATIDEDARRRFEAAWQRGQPGAIEDFLPAPERPTYRATLEELIHIELECAWKQWGAAPAEVRARLPVRLVEDYLGRFPVLRDPAIVRRLVEQEFRVREQVGDSPSSDSYHQRFPDLVEAGQDLRTTLHGSPPSAGQAPNLPDYRILGVLGRGGMGVVYKARQLSLNRLVALKLIAAGGSASDEHRARFRTEAEAVARLQHPHIIHIHEIGETAGCAYLVLEYLAGGSLAGLIKPGPLPPRTAAQLLRQIAGAVAYAHERGIIHRDLKPANILLTVGSGQWALGSEEKVRSQRSEVSREPAALLPTAHCPLPTFPKIADFGLAKLLDEGDGHTLSGAPLGTPSYMAPEQAEGRMSAVGPAADIYALGAILYELTTGRPPFQADTALHTLELVRTQEPVPPTRLQPSLPRDLETICLKCLHKDPARRYPSAQEFAEDLDRFLVGEPIRARPTPPWERGVKWARRRPAVAALIAVSALAALVLLGVILTTNALLKTERDFAEEKRKDAEDATREAVANLRLAVTAVDQMLTRVSDERLVNVPQSEKVRRGLLGDALQFIRRLAEQHSDDPELNLELMRAHHRLAQVCLSLGDHAGGEDNLRQAISRGEDLRRRLPDQLERERELANCYANLGTLRVEMGRGEGEADLRTARSLLERLLREHPDEAACTADLAAVLDRLAQLRQRDLRHDESEALFAESVRLLEGLVARHPTDAGHARQLALLRNNLAGIYGDRKRFADAEVLFRRNLAYWEALAGEHAEVADYRSKLALTCRNVCQVLKDQGRLGEAEQFASRCTELRRQAAEDFPDSPYFRLAHGDALRLWADIALLRGCAGEASKLAEQGLVSARQALRADPKANNGLVVLRRLHETLARAMLRLEDHEAAARTVAALSQIKPMTAPQWFTAAVLMGGCIPLVERDTKLETGRRVLLGEEYTRETLRLLQEAIRGGYKDRSALEKEPAFSGLRSRKEFQELLASLPARS
jgi:serine/threonine protein kinase/tetratricopeptide (TPR) repeat protein